MKTLIFETVRIKVINFRVYWLHSSPTTLCVLCRDLGCMNLEEHILERYSCSTLLNVEKAIDTIFYLYS